MLYFRTFLMMIISFYTTRVVLNALGEVDYGVNSAVCGFIGMFSILTASLSTAISRYITYELGAGDEEKLQKVFSSSIIVLFIMAAILAILLESIGVWFLNTHMNIPPERMKAANWILQFSVINTFVGMTYIPYIAAITSHEKMDIFAYFSIIDAVIALLLAFLIQLDIWPDRLIFYAAFGLANSVLMSTIYRIYCKRHFKECRFKLVFEKSLVKEMFGFAGWNFIGASSAILKTQGVGVLFNIFCGPIVNAAQGVAGQASGLATKFSGSFMSAMNPQITKSYASNDREYMYSLVFQGTRFAFFLFFILALPIFFETETLLTLWLKQVPEHTIAFVRINLITTIIDSILAGPLITVMLANGNIKNYQLIVGGIQMLGFPFAYIVLKLGGSPEAVQIMLIFIAIACMISRSIMLIGMADFPAMAYLKDVVLKILQVTVIACLIPLVAYKLMPHSILNDLIICAIAALSACGAIWLFGLKKTEKVAVLEQIYKFLNIKQKNEDD